ncbi:MAG: 2OG-Fe(II) oxygenase [Gammaproteobacteria bacterium]|nr:2OG-Fe(II) oxygenase [Gammaproteobacteria bacterium]
MDLSGARLETDPFPFSVVPGALSDGMERATLSWFEDSAPWRLTRECFYSQQEFDMRDIDLPSDIAPLAASATLAGMRELVSELFERRLEATVDIVAHRLTAGQRIRIHNDYLEKGETHRLVMQLNRGWTPGDGGYLMLFGSGRPEDVRVVLAPTSKQALLFEISHGSHHAVSEVTRGERYSIVYSFHAGGGW